MTYYLRAHRAVYAVVWSTVLSTVAWVGAGTVIPVPQINHGGASQVLMELLLAVLFTPVVVDAFGGGSLLFEYGGIRRLWLYDLLLLLMVLVPVVVVVGVAGMCGDGGFAWSFARNALFFVGLALGTLGVLGERIALIASIGYFLVIATIGGRTGGGAYWWAALRLPADGRTMLTATAIMILGVTVYCLRARRRSVLHS